MTIRPRFACAMAWMAAALALCGAEAAPSGSGFTVQPGGLQIQGLVPGQAHDLEALGGAPLTVTNRDVVAHTFNLSAYRPSELGSGRWLEGYEEIPDPTWLSFEPSVLTVAPGGTGQARMVVRVPDGPAFFNRHWAVSVAVRVDPAEGEGLALAVYPRFYLETEAAELSTAGGGPLVVSPGTVGVGEDGADLMIYGAPGSEYDLELRTVTPAPDREVIQPTPGRSWIPEASWMAVDPIHVRADATGAGRVRVRAMVPETARRDAWEALLMIRPAEGGAPRFARVQWTPES